VGRGKRQKGRAKEKCEPGKYFWMKKGRPGYFRQIWPGGGVKDHKKDNFC